MRGLGSRLLLAAAALLALGAQAPAPAPAPDVRVWRLDCGSGDLEKNFFNDTRAFPEGARVRVVVSCYLIRHGDDLLLWGTGFALDTIGKPGPFQLKQGLAPQLAAIGVKPEQVGMVGISHSHYDHTGQAASFPKAKLLIGAREFDALFGPQPILKDAAAPLQGWADGANVQKVSGDLDIYKDGTVTVLSLPGHTPGHLGLLLRLRKSGYVILSGDQWHFAENRAVNGVPGFNFDRAQTLASSAKLEGLIRNLKARLVIEHEPADAKAFPAPPAYLD